MLEEVESDSLIKLSSLEKTMSDQSLRCSSCGSDHVISGIITGGEDAYFHPKETKNITLSFSSPYFYFTGEAFLCINCGFLLAKIDVSEARKKLGVWGTDALKQRLGIE